MYVVTYENGRSEEIHVGDLSTHEEREYLRDRAADVTEVQADGHELEAIQRKFTVNGHCTIPMPNNRVCNWYGDLAKTIHMNLISSKGFGM